MNELTLLYSIAVAAMEATSLDSLLDRTIQIIGEAFHPLKDVGIGLVDEPGGVFRTRIWYKGKLEVHHLPLGQGVLGGVVETGLPIRIGNASDIPEYVPLHERQTSELCVPLKIGSRVIGVINAESDQANAFDYEDERLMVALAGQLVTAIERVRLHQDAIRTAERWSVIYQAARQIGESLSSEQVYQAVHSALERLLQFDALFVALLDDAVQVIENVYLIKDGKRYDTNRFPVDKGLTARVIATGEALHEDDFSPEESDLEPVGYGNHRMRSLLIVPMMVGGKTIGALSVQSLEAYKYSATDREALDLVASRVGIALINAQLFDEVQRLAEIDSLTGITNRRKFFELAEMEFKRARRYDRPLCVTMFDLDHFKQVNDNYGHHVGDQVLRAIAGYCAGIVRDGDVLGRYGGEEFVILLPETDLEKAIQVAERLRKLVEAFKVETQSGVITITISLGVTELDGTCASLDMLLDRADQALYDAKGNGRNQYQVYGQRVDAADKDVTN